MCASYILWACQKWLYNKYRSNNSAWTCMHKIWIQNESNKNENVTAEEAKVLLAAFFLLFGYENQQNWLFFFLFLSVVSPFEHHSSWPYTNTVWFVGALYEPYRGSKSTNNNNGNSINNSNNNSHIHTTRVLTLADNIKTTFQIRMAHVKNGRYYYVTYNPYPFFT